MRFASPLTATALSLAFSIAGCAQGAVTPVDGGAAGDASSPRDAGSDGGRRDSGPASCGEGEHACGSGCVTDLANDPANGCRNGCGEECSTPANGVASCTEDGACTWACEPPFVRSGDACTCSPRTCEDMGYECGAPDDGCGSPLDCGSCASGAACTDGLCACTPDAYEGNDTNSTATLRETLDDSDDPDTSIAGATLDDASDQDWFRFPITDGTDGGNPRITVTLSNIPIGSDYDLTAYYACGDSTDASSCSSGTADNYVGRGCANHVTGSSPESVEIAVECDRGLFNSDDSGSLYVRVVAPTWATTCGTYDVAVAVR